MSILSFALKKRQRSVVWLYFFVLETKREMNQQPEVLKKKEQRKKRSRIWGICGQISSLRDIFSKRKLVPDVLQKSAMTFCKQDASLRRKPSAINEMVSFL